MEVNENKDLEDVKDPEDVDQTAGDDQSSTGDEPGQDNGKADGTDKETKIEFTPEQQSLVDAIVKDRLARAKKKQEEHEEQLRKEAERTKLEEANEFKKLYENAQAELAAAKQAVVDSSKRSALSNAGYSDKQVELLLKLVDGETNEEISTSIELLKTTVPPTTKKYADPGTGNGKKDKPNPTTLNDKGRSAYQRLKEAGKIRRKK